MGQNGDYEIPLVGLGTWLTNPDEVANSVKSALDSGYCLIDTAYVYGNEKEIGFAINSWLKFSGAERKKLFVTTKLPPIGMSPNKVEHFCKLSLHNLGLNFLDLYLIHLPVGLKYKDDKEIMPKNEDGTLAVDFDTSLEGIWKKMEKLVDDGLVKSIGISNFNETQIQRIINIAKIKPAVLQVEIHVYMQQKALRQFCVNEGIVLQAYSPFANPGKPEHFIDVKEYTSPLENEIVKEIAENCKKTPAQILLKFLVQQGIAVIPKSIHTERIQENINIFDFVLTEEQMILLENLDRESSGRTVDFSFFGPEFKTHLEYPFIKHKE